MQENWKGNGTSALVFQISTGLAGSLSGLTASAPAPPITSPSQPLCICSAADDTTVRASEKQHSWPPRQTKKTSHASPSRTLAVQLPPPPADRLDTIGSQRWSCACRTLRMTSRPGAPISRGRPCFSHICMMNTSSILSLPFLLIAIPIPSQSSASDGSSSRGYGRDTGPGARPPSQHDHPRGL